MAEPVETSRASNEAGINATTNLVRESKNLQDATFQIKDGMDQMTAGARKINETGAALSDLSSQMKQSIAKIGDEIDQFKV